MTSETHKNRSLHLPGIRHSAPIPLGARVGNMIFSSAIMGSDPATGTWPSDPKTQVELAFRNMAALVAEGGGTIREIGQVTVLIASEDVRSHIDPEWLRYFPDENDRPARHVVVGALRRGLAVQLQFIAVLADGGGIQRP
jgi:2-iminobutanoate/2-iminopropanoate deaminase